MLVNCFNLLLASLGTFRSRKQDIFLNREARKQMKLPDLGNGQASNPRWRGGDGWKEAVSFRGSQDWRGYLWTASLGQSVKGCPRMGLQSLHSQQVLSSAKIPYKCRGLHMCTAKDRSMEHIRRSGRGALCVYAFGRSSPNTESTILVRPAQLVS